MLLVMLCLVGVGWGEDLHWQESNVIQLDESSPLIEFSGDPVPTEAHFSKQYYDCVDYVEETDDYIIVHMKLKET